MTRRATAVADAVFERLPAAYAEAADPERARGMAAYMRNQFVFLGLATPARRALDRALLRGLPAPVEADVEALVRGCWARAEREYQYFAVDYASRHVGVCGPSFIPVVRHAVTHRSWWDTVDGLAANVAGPMVRAYPELVAVMDEWVAGPELWLARAALLHQLHAKAGTDEARLFGYCRMRAGDEGFFIRKAIGWALREYSKTAPDAVRAFVRDHEAELSPLSRREALAWLGRSGT